MSEKKWKVVEDRDLYWLKEIRIERSSDEPEEMHCRKLEKKGWT